MRSILTDAFEDAAAEKSSHVSSAAELLNMDEVFTALLKNKAKHDLAAMGLEIRKLEIETIESV